jgi:hypothetical protein
MSAAHLALPQYDMPGGQLASSFGALLSSALDQVGSTGAALESRW